MRSASAMPTMARACFTRAAATPRFWLFSVASLIRAVSASSSKARHHSPRGWASAGRPTIQVVPSPASTTTCGSLKAPGIATPGCMNRGGAQAPSRARESSAAELLALCVSIQRFPSIAVASW
jgi:hypothetical protein